MDNRLVSNAIAQVHLAMLPRMAGVQMYRW